MASIEMLKESYNKKKKIIKARLREFKKKKSNQEKFEELCFCLLTPQSKAKICWKAVLELKKNKLLLKGDKNQVLPFLKGVRFADRKAEYIIGARRFFGKIKLNRNWLVKNIKGLGYKESSHILRNIGSTEYAILDRHVLKNLKKYNVIKEIPKTLTKKRYLEMEQKMKSFSQEIRIPFEELDLLFWSQETGEVFK